MEGKILNERLDIACEHCNTAFKSCHMCHEGSHTGEKPHLCNLCNKAFAKKNTLEDHNYSQPGKKTQIHILWDKAFAKKNILEDHNYYHTGEKAFKCNSCDKAFQKKQQLYNHAIIHNGRKPYECHTCHKAFHNISHLMVHVRTHTGERPYLCHLCDKTFITRGHLKSHSRFHIGEKPYQCNLCRKVFTGKSDVKRHIRIHTGEKPYKCDICGKAFAQSSSHKRHVFVKHHSRGPLLLNALCQNVESSIMERRLECTSHGTSSIPTEYGSCVNGRVSSLTETTAELSIWQNNKPSPDIKELSGNHWTINTDVSPVELRLCGCGICDELFEIEKEFMEHCFHHCDAPQSDTFVDLFDHLSSCSCGEAV